MRLIENSKANKTATILLGCGFATYIFNVLYSIIRVMGIGGTFSFSLASVFQLISIAMLVYLTINVYTKLNIETEKVLKLFQIYLIVVPVCSSLQTLSMNIMYGERLVIVDVLLTIIEFSILFVPAILAIHFAKKEGTTAALKVVAVVEVVIFIFFNLFSFMRAITMGFGRIATFPSLHVLLTYIALLVVACNIEQQEKPLSFVDMNEENIAKNVILSIVTFGIYEYIWMYRMSRKIKGLHNENTSSASEIICLLLVPFYSLYWVYTRTKSLNLGANRKGVRISDNSALYLILTFLGLHIVSVALMQNDLNAVIGEKTIVYSENQNNNSDKAKNTSSDMEKLEQLASLYEKGIITEEEYNVKKQDILSRF